MQYKESIWGKIKNFVGGFSRLTWTIIAIVGVTIIALVIAIIIGNNKKNAKENSTLVLNLIGPKTVTVYYGEEYVEYGYKAEDATDGDITDKVLVDEADLDTSVVGEYTIIYSITNSVDVTVTETRKVIVQKSSATRTEFKLELNGSLAIDVFQYESYTEPGFSAYDNVDGDLTDKVNVDGEIDTSEIGEQILTYSVTNTNGDIIYKERVINIKPSDIYIGLVGSENITITQGSKYTDAGCFAYNNEENISSEITYSGTVNTKVIGNYTITCTLNYNDKSLKKERKVKVESSGNTAETGKITITLIGQSIVNVYQGETYQELGATATDSVDGNITNKIVKYGNVDTTKLGVYNVFYSVSNSTGIIKNISRIVNVIEKTNLGNNLNLTLEVSTTQITKNSVRITGIVSGDNYKKVILPDLKETTRTSFIYETTNNGTFGFKLYNTIDDTYKSFTVTINNIDNIPPTATCVMNVNKNEATINVTATDEKSSITGYKYKLEGKNYGDYVETNTYKMSYQNEGFAYVMVKDSLGNATNDIKCTNGTIINMPVQIDGTLYKEATSDTLIVRIKKENNMYLTYIWAQNPYLQLRKYSASDFNKNNAKINAIMNSALDNAKTNSGVSIKDKVALAFNNDISSKYKCHYCKTWKDLATTGLLINNGVALRNDSTTDGARHIFAGITESNKLTIYNEKLPENSNAEGRKVLYEKAVTTDKIKNTITGLHVLINNNGDIRSDYPNNSATRQAMCMLDSNNFIQFTTTKSIKLKKLGQLGKTLGCKVMINMDGGGSRALYLKTNKNTNWSSKLVTTNRGPYYSVLYWTEL